MTDREGVVRRDIHPSLITRKYTEDDPRDGRVLVVDSESEDGAEPKWCTRPPIEKIEMPKCVTKSALIRWLIWMGYEVAEVARYLGIKYQMVRNIKTTVPKRAAREDLPPPIIYLKQEVDVFAQGMDGALDESLMQERRERKAAEKMQRRADREAGLTDQEDQED
jgi:hypothetical protein